MLVSPVDGGAQRAKFAPHGASGATAPLAVCRTRLDRHVGDRVAFEKICECEDGIGDAARSSDLVLAGLCLDRIAPPRKDRPIPFSLPALGKAADASASLAAIIAGVASGDLTPSEAGELSKVVDTYARALLATELEDRVTALERERK